jgi:hypothetical protein
LSPSRTIMLTDRSACELDDKCGMALWWNRKEGGSGMSPAITAEELQVGSEIHADLEWAATSADISPEMVQIFCDGLAIGRGDEERQSQKLNENLIRRQGWLAAYCLFLEPKIRLEYDNVLVEDELVLNRDPLWVGITPDRILRNKQSGKLVYREYKSTKDAGYKWINSWPFAIQLHVGMKAVEEELGEPVQFAQIMGLLKGRDYDGRLSHPYVWAWFNQTTGAWTHEYTKARGADWTHRPVWEYPGGIVKWVQACGEETARSLFPHSQPVFLNNRMLEDWCGRRTHREKVIREVEESCRESWETRVIYFEPRTQHCRPAWGNACPYLGACWNAEIQRNPLARGEFVPRTPHHNLELTLSED